MKRSAPLPRRTRLRARSRLQRKKRLNPVGARKKREEKDLERFRREVKERAGWRCERCGKRTRNLHAHHMLPKGRCGSNDTENGACLCGGPTGCHRRIHDHLVDDWRRWFR